MAITANSLTNMLNIFSQRSLEQFIASMPPRNVFTENFDDDVAAGGQIIYTRLGATSWGSANDLSKGWQSTIFTGSAISGALKLRDFDTPFNLNEWATVTPKILTDMALTPMAHQLANSIVVDAMAQISASNYTNYLTGSSAASFSITGSFSLQSASIALTAAEIPVDPRYAIVNPNTFAAVTNNVIFTYQYGSADVVQRFKNLTLMGFNPVFPYARLSGASLPQGGDAIKGTGNGGTLIGICGHSQGLVLAVRQPLDLTPTGVFSAVAVDPTSKISLMTFLVWDPSGPVWRLGAASLYAVSAGNTKAIVPIFANTSY